MSADDLKVGVGEALGLFDNGLGDTTKIVVANVGPAAVFDRIFRPSLVVAAGPVKLGITAVIDPEILEKLSDPDKATLLPTIKNPDAVLPGVLADLESKSDYQVLLVQAKPEMAKQLAEANPGFDVVVATSQFDDVLSRDPEMLNGGKTMLVTVGKKGKHVGLVGLYPHDSPRERFLMVTLNKQFSNSAGPMKALIQDEYRDMLKATGTVANFLRRGTLSGATFVGAETCKKCHPNTFQFWSKPNTPTRLKRSSTIPSRTRSMTQNALAAIRPALNTTQAGNRKRQPRTWRAISAKTATVPARST